MAKHMLEVHNLKVTFDTYGGEVHSVRGVDLHLDEGETLAIVGESGCGKSVTVQTIMRLNNEPPARIVSGSILYKGEDLARKSMKEMQDYRGKEISMIFQDAMVSLNPTMKIGKQITEGIKKHRGVNGPKAKAIAIEMLKKVGIPNPERSFGRYPHTFSGGMRQRVMIAMALSCNPGILIADEPTTALDVTTQAQILALMNQIKKEFRTSIILITHNLGVVAKMADRVAVMYAGQVVERGTLEDIFYRAKHPYTWGLLRSMPDIARGRGERIGSIPGAPPDLFSPPAGCAFAARCPHAMNICFKREPGEYTVSEHHASKCWLMDERASASAPASTIDEVPLPPDHRP